MILCFHCVPHINALIMPSTNTFFGTYLVFSQLVHFFTFSLPRVVVESVACKAHVDSTVRYFFGTYLVFSQLVHFFTFSLPQVAVESVAC
jgi:hypothetical protein